MRGYGYKYFFYRHLLLSFCREAYMHISVTCSLVWNKFNFYKLRYGHIVVGTPTGTATTPLTLWIQGLNSTLYNLNIFWSAPILLLDIALCNLRGVWNFSFTLIMWLAYVRMLCKKFQIFYYWPKSIVKSSIINSLIEESWEWM